MNKTVNVKFNVPLQDLNIKPLSIAKFFYKKGITSHLFTQKLIYFAFIEGLKNNLLFFSERFQAWKYGPVLTSVFEEMTYCENIDDMFSKVPILRQEKVKVILEKIYRDYRKWNVWDLVDESHKGPWAKTRGNLSLEEVSTQEIDLKDLINFADAQKQTD